MDQKLKWCKMVQDKQDKTDVIADVREDVLWEGLKKTLVKNPPSTPPKERTMFFLEGYILDKIFNIF